MQVADERVVGPGRRRGHLVVFRSEGEWAPWLNPGDASLAGTIGASPKRPKVRRVPSAIGAASATGIMANRRTCPTSGASRPEIGDGQANDPSSERGRRPRVRVTIGVARQLGIGASARDGRLARPAVGSESVMTLNFRPRRRSRSRRSRPGSNPCEDDVRRHRTMRRHPPASQIHGQRHPKGLTRPAVLALPETVGSHDLVAYLMGAPRSCR